MDLIYINPFVEPKAIRDLLSCGLTKNVLSLADENRI